MSKQTINTVREAQHSVIEEAFSLYAKNLCRYALRRVHDMKVSEDLVSETFMRTWAYLLKNHRIDSMESFLYHTLNNLIIDEYRKKKNVSLDSMMETGFEPSEEDWRERYFDREEGKLIFLLLELLPEKYRNILRMKYEQDLSLDEISQITGETKNAVSVEIHRGIGRLRNISDRNHVLLMSF